MLYDPADHYEPEETAQDFKENSKLYERFMKVKKSRPLKMFRKKTSGNKPSNKTLLKMFFNLLP